MGIRGHPALRNQFLFRKESEVYEENEFWKSVINYDT